MKDSKGLRTVLAVGLTICVLPLFVLCVIASFFKSIVEWVKDLVDVVKDYVEMFVSWCTEPCEEETIESEENVVLDEEENEEP